METELKDRPLSSILVVGDLHLYHDMLWKRGYRPADFTTRLMTSLRQMVGEDDALIDLGDVIFYRQPTLRELLREIPGQKILVRGNHDKKSTKWYLDAGYSAVVTSLELAGVLFTHRPSPELTPEIEFNVHGHWHVYPPTLPPWYDLTRYRMYSPELADYKPVRLEQLLKMPLPGVVEP